MASGILILLLNDISRVRMTHRWIHRPVQAPHLLAEIQKELNDLTEALARALLLRGVKSFEQARLFFRPSRDHLNDPFEMMDMEAAAKRLAAAIETNEKVLVYGDYDVDGTTATALMVSFLREQGAEALYFIPDRFKDGYGLKRRGIDYAAEMGASLIVTLDCGITAVDEARYAQSKNLDVIICDHHTPKDTLPEALAVIDPKRNDCHYPFKELSGCGIAYKLATATLREIGEDPSKAHQYLDLVAVSTASDIVPILGENRVLMREGLDLIARSPRLGISRLADIAELNLSTCSTSDIVFKIGPRINAAGRLGHASLAVDLLLSDDEVEASRIARELDAMNTRRRSLDAETLKSAVAQADRHVTSGHSHSVVLHDSDWHLGVLGIVASRIVERYYRPAVLLSTSQGEAKGSARSITGLNVHAALGACSDLLTQYGGHDFAAGLSLPEENVPAFRRRFDEVVRDMIDPENLVPAIEVDAHLDLNDIDSRFWAVLRQFAPFGPENPQPVFHAREVHVKGRPRAIGAGGQHLKFTACNAEGECAVDVIAFKMGDRLPIVEKSMRKGEPLEALFSIEENHWNGQTTLQLRVRDLRGATPQSVARVMA